MNYSDETNTLIIRSAKAMKENPDWRWGQAVYNTAWFYYTEIVQTMPEYVNPFQRDYMVDIFLRWLEYKLEENR